MAAVDVTAIVAAGAVDTAGFSPREKPEGAPVLAAATHTHQRNELRL